MDAPKPTLEVLQGLPASGKTTHARKLVEQGNWIRVNKDDLRKMMDNSVHTDSNEKRVLRIRNQIIIDALASQKNVVVDDTNFAPYHLRDLSALAQQMEAKFHVTFIDTPLEDCLMRNDERGDDAVPTEVILDMYKKYLEPKTNTEDKTKELKEVNDELDEAIIVDIDGTLANIGGDNPRNIYDASRAMEDILSDPVSNVAAMAYKHGYKVIILTGRHSGHLEVTKRWLEENGVNYDYIWTRAEGDKRNDTIVKEELYREHIEGKFNIKYVIDDRPSVCRMWRELGLFTFQVGDPHVEF